MRGEEKPSACSCCTDERNDGGTRHSCREACPEWMTRGVCIRRTGGCSGSSLWVGWPQVRQTGRVGAAERWRRSRNRLGAVASWRGRSRAHERSVLVVDSPHGTVLDCTGSGTSACEWLTVFLCNQTWHSRNDLYSGGKGRVSDSVVQTTYQSNAAWLSAHRRLLA
jgi:hypothetical protein